MKLPFFGSQQDSLESAEYTNFSYLDPKVTYMDSACQTLRPAQVVNKETEYYYKYNSCGHRVKYKWGYQTDEEVEKTREEILKLCGKSSKDYLVSFNLNTTAGINQVLYQLDASKYNQIIVSDIDHSSVFIPSIRWAQQHDKERVVVERSVEEKTFGEVDLAQTKLNKPVLLTNSHSNIDSRSARNLPKVADQIHEAGGVVLVDACQTFGHEPEFLKNVDFDAAFGSGHKMYGPSVGFMVIKKSLVKDLDYFWLGGSTISDNGKDSYDVVADPDELWAPLEPGLQNFAGIIGLGEAIRWRNSLSFTLPDGKKVSPSEYEHDLALYFHEQLKDPVFDVLKVTSPEKSATVSFWLDKLDSHKLAAILGEKGIYFRTGYHCCYYYLKHKMKYPALARLSLGLNNTRKDVDTFITALKQLISVYS
jgi:selenocysteine lyase/cysteine desulfurase